MLAGGGQGACYIWDEVHSLSHPTTELVNVEVSKVSGAEWWLPSCVSPLAGHTCKLTNARPHYPPSMSLSISVSVSVYVSLSLTHTHTLSYVSLHIRSWL